MLFVENHKLDCHVLVDYSLLLFQARTDKYPMRRGDKNFVCVENIVLFCTQHAQRSDIIY